MNNTIKTKADLIKMLEDTLEIDLHWSFEVREKADEALTALNEWVDEVIGRDFEPHEEPELGILTPHYLSEGEMSQNELRAEQRTRKQQSLTPSKLKENET